MLKNKIALLCCIWCAAQGISGVEESLAATSADYVAVPPFVSSGAPPLVMLVMGRDHKLYYEAYNDASDLNADGELDIRYTPTIDYYGYFDSYKCYEYSTADSRFNPTSKTTDKTCDGTKWSGDYLNYLTMSRMDTMRKVLYGGYRSTDDSTGLTVLQRVYVPQDAHTWGKEYKGVNAPDALVNPGDGYDIAKYTPFTAPAAGSNLRHLFASTTLSANGTPILRYALNNTHRIWDWVAKEAPVADTSIQTAASGHPGHPNDHLAFEGMVTAFANTANRMGTGAWLDWTVRNHVNERFPAPNAATFGAIDGYGNPWGASGYIPHVYGAADQENYLAIFTGVINVTTAGTYDFGLDGDDAVEVIIDGGTPQQLIVGYYGAHGVEGAAVPTHTGTIAALTAGPHTVEFRMEEAGGADQYFLYWRGPDSANAWQIIPNTSFTALALSTYRLNVPASTITDLDVRVKVCDPAIGLEANCKQYPNGQYKPIGLLQRHGEAKRMYFGLMTGSFAKSTSGGVLRKRIGDISTEITANTGQFDTAQNGIIQTLNKLRIYGYDYGVRNYNQNCGWITSGPMTEGQCRDWGSPVAEMTYEAQRYFAGKGAATAAYDYSGTTDDSNLTLPKDSWNDPYGTKAQGGFDSCSKPFILMLSDINPSYDSDQLPGVATEFGAGIASDLPATLPAFDAKALADAISAGEPATPNPIAGSRYIGQSGVLTGTSADTLCSAKTVTSLGNIRGLCPEEPTKRGGYYSASAAYYGHKTDLRPDKTFDQKVMTYAVGLASPLPRIELTLGPDKKQITLVPFGKTVASLGNTVPWAFNPTNTIVDFFVETLTPTYGKFRINYEDVEQGADHDMDAIASYEYQLIDALDNDVTDPANATQVKLTLTSEYASGSYIQHMGYIISGTTADGTYLEIRDMDTLTPADDVFLTGVDTLPAAYTGYVGTKLPQSTYRKFSPASTGGTTPAQLLTNPLWYAAKWGAFEDKNSDGIPNGIDGDEWDKDKDGVPDTYYYVTNPLRLEEQLNKSFADILNQASSGTAASVISNTRSGEGAVYQSVFYPSKIDSTANANSVSWVGQVHGLLVDGQGNMREDALPGNKKLDVKGPDLNGNGRVYHEDINMNCVLDTQTVDTDGNGVLDTEDINHNGLLETDLAGPCVAYPAAGSMAFLEKLDPIIRYNAGVGERYYDVNGDSILQDREMIWKVPASAPDVSESHPINYLWNSSEWLNSITDADIVTQRSTFLSTTKQRHIFTWIDTGNKVVDPNEIKDFVWPTTPPVLADLDDTDKIYPYLHLYSSFADRPAAISALSATDFSDFLLKETEREMKYIRGLDYVNATGGPVPLHIGASDIPGTELRARKYDGKTWRLGDIAYSTPTAVGKPAEGYHLLYQDDSYARYADKYEKRRNVIYTGANDGMLHAFNGGFYDGFNKQFCRELTAGYNPYDLDTTNDVGCVPDATTTQPELGAELWAYIPYNLLPHLHWLTETTYKHSYYVDQKPRIFEAKIFPNDADHPEGWGAVMVVGMRFGGASVVPDIIKTNDVPGKVPDAAELLQTKKSAFLIFDITNPEVKPRLLAEITMPKMGFSTSYPTVVAMKDGNHNGSFEGYTDAAPETGENRWFLAFGSGPADGLGDPAPAVLGTAASSQKANFYLLDLVKLASKNELHTLTDNAGPPAKHGVLTAGLWPYSTLDDNTFVGDPIAVDYNLDFNWDALYYGTVTKGATKWEGMLRRIIIDDRDDVDQDQDPSNWQHDSILFNAGQPISAAPAAGFDDEKRNWVYFGTGRYYVAVDGVDQNLQSYYGIKEPIDTSVTPAKRTWATVVKTDLIDTTDYKVFTDAAQTTGMGPLGLTPQTWQDLIDEQKTKGGWYIDFLDDDGVTLEGERNLGQAALLGGALSFTTFVPSSDVCVAGGESYLWEVFYKTGTAYFDPIIGTRTVTFNSNTMEESLRKVSLGEGLATSPNIHVGSEEGSKAYVQTSTGEIKVIDQKNPFSVKSGMRSWRESE